MNLGPSIQRVRRAVELTTTVATSVAILACKALIRSISSNSDSSLPADVRQVVPKLGPTAIKIVQMLAARRDILPVQWSKELSELHDNAPPMNAADFERAWRAVQQEHSALRTIDLDPEPIGSGSIACVYRGTLCDATTIAIKLRRPNVARRMRDELWLIRHLMYFLEWSHLSGGMPFADLVDFMSKAILGQIDLSNEANSLERLRLVNLDSYHLHIPSVYRSLSGHSVLAMEYIADLNSISPNYTTGAIRTALHFQWRSLAVTGFVHCDLHPGNVYLKDNGDLVVLDAGYSVELCHDTRRGIGEFFQCLKNGMGIRCGQIMIEAAVSPPDDGPAFIDDIATLVDNISNNSSFNMSDFGSRIFALQSSHRLHARSDFVFPLMSLMILEGTLKQLNSNLDISSELAEVSF